VFEKIVVGYEGDGLEEVRELLPDSQELAEATYHWSGQPCTVLGYDRSESSRHAASWATNLLLAGGKLVIVHACRLQHLPAAPLSTQGERHDLGRAILDELMLDGEDALLDIDLESEVSDDDPVSAPIAAARPTTLVRSCSAPSIILGCMRRLGQLRPSC